jgi:hypothetical protein
VTAAEEHALQQNEKLGLTGLDANAGDQSCAVCRQTIAQGTPRYRLDGDIHGECCQKNRERAAAIPRRFAEDRSRGLFF